MNFFQKGGGVNPKVYILFCQFLTKLETMIFKAGDQNNSFNSEVFEIQFSISEDLTKKKSQIKKKNLVKSLHFEGGGQVGQGQFEKKF